MRSNWILAASCALISASLLTATAAAQAQRSRGPAPAKKETPEKVKPAQPAKQEFPEHNVRFETPAGWEPAGAAGTGCSGAYVLAMNLPIKPIKVNVKPGEKMPPVPPSGYASSFTFVVNPADVDGSSLDAAVETMQAHIKKTFADAAFLPAKDLKVAGEPAKQFIASFEIPSADGGPAIPRKQTIVLAGHAGKLYRLALQASVPNFERDRTGLDRVIRTLAWLDASGAAGKAAAKAKRFKNDIHGLEFGVPAGWDEAQSSNPSPNTIAIFAAPPKQNGQGAGVIISVSQHDSKGPDLDALVAAISDGIRGHDAAARFEPADDATLGGEPAKSFICRVKIGSIELVSKYVVGLHAGKAYTIDYTASPDAYEQYLTALKQVTDSFRWTTQGGATTKPATPAGQVKLAE